MKEKPLQKDFETMLTCLEHNPEEFFDYIQQTYSHLPSKEQQTEEHFLIKFLLWLKPLFIVEGNQLYGRAYVPKQLAVDAQKTASIITVANLWNIITAVPILLIAFADLPGGFLIALFLGWCILAFSNETGALAASHRPGKPATAATIGFVLINIVLTILSGPGTELAMNTSKLSERHADFLVQKRAIDPLRIEVASTTKTVEQGKIAQAQCDQKLDSIKQKPQGDPERNLIYEQILGSHADRNNREIWHGKPTEDLPLCIRAARLEAEGQIQLKNAQAMVDQELAESQRVGSFLYLKEQHPAIFNENFRSNSSVKSGVDAVRLATKEFNKKVVRTDFAGLGLSLFSFALSVITSGTALWLISSYSRRRDVQKSYDEEILKMRSRFFESLRRTLK